MTENDIPGLAELCQAIREDDVGALPGRMQAFVARNLQIVTALDRLSQATMSSGDASGALRMLELLEQFVPDNPFITVRRIQAAIVAGKPHAASELVQYAPRINNGALLFHAVEHLVAHGFLDEADALTTACATQVAHSPGVIAACHARVTVARGNLHGALAILAPAVSGDAAHPIAIRYRLVVLESLLDFQALAAGDRDLAIRWGEDHDLIRVVERLLFTFETDAARAALRDAAQANPAQAGLVASLTARVDAVQAELDAAMAEHGPLALADPDAVHAALTRSGTPASRVLWGKASLAALLRRGEMTEAAFGRFDWFLPNWEDAAIRKRVLATARRAIPAVVRVRHRWLNHLMTIAAYADAAAECHTQLSDGIGGDTLFQAVVLLRLQQDGTVPSFMDPALFDALREHLFARVAEAEPGFVDVMYDHLVSLGWVPRPWPVDTPLPPDSPAASLHRRLFAVTTGRLGRTTTGTQAAARHLRPVLALSGQLRGFEAAWPSIHDAVCHPAGTPVLISVWDKSVNAMGRHARRLERMLPDDVVARLKPEERYTDTFATAYPRTAGLLFGQTDVSATAVRALVDASGCDVVGVETESETPLESVFPRFVSSNMLKMYYKFARLEVLLRDHEVRTGQAFSHVIWVRPDCEIVRLQPRDLLDCLERPDIAWSSFVTENSFGDYLMVLPRRAFSVIAGIFSRVCLAGDTRMLPWRPSRPDAAPGAGALAAFGGPDVLFDILLAAGYMPYNRIPRIVVRLRGRTPGEAAVRAMFHEEVGGRQLTSMPG